MAKGLGVWPTRHMIMGMRTNHCMCVVEGRVMIEAGLLPAMPLMRWT